MPNSQPDSQQGGLRSDRRHKYDLASEKATRFAYMWAVLIVLVIVAFIKVLLTLAVNPPPARPEKSIPLSRRTPELTAKANYSYASATAGAGNLSALVSQAQDTTTQSQGSLIFRHEDNARRTGEYKIAVCKNHGGAHTLFSISFPLTRNGQFVGKWITYEACAKDWADAQAVLLTSQGLSVTRTITDSDTDGK